MKVSDITKFYESDNQEYIIEKNYDFLNWYEEKMKKGYRPYLNLNKIQELINKITQYYEFKYPDRLLDINYGYIYKKFKKIQKIVDCLDVDQLRYRLSFEELETLDCEYHGCGAYTRPVEEQDKKEGLIFGDDDYIDYVVLYLKNKKNSKSDWKEKEYMISATVKGGIVNKQDLNVIKEISNLNFGDNNMTLEDLYDKLKNNNELDVSELEKVLFTHATDLELRNKILELVNLALIYSKKTNPEYGQIRANKLSEEFKSYYGVNLDCPNINDLVTNKVLIKIFNKK